MSILWSQLHYWSRFQYWCQLHYGNLFHGGSGIGSTNGLPLSVSPFISEKSFQTFHNPIRTSPTEPSSLQVCIVRNGRRFAELLLSPGRRITSFFLLIGHGTTIIGHTAGLKTYLQYTCLVNIQHVYTQHAFSREVSHHCRASSRNRLNTFL